MTRIDRVLLSRYHLAGSAIVLLNLARLLDIVMLSETALAVVNVVLGVVFAAMLAGHRSAAWRAARTQPRRPVTHHS